MNMQSDDIRLLKEIDERGYSFNMQPTEELLNSNTIEPIDNSLIQYSTPLHYVRKDNPKGFFFVLTEVHKKAYGIVKTEVFSLISVFDINTQFATKEIYEEN